jgi:predicted RNase H-like HicB family nuclease
MRLYRAIAFQSPGDGPEDGWDVIFPAFPGCVAQGDTAEEAIENATEALSLHVDGMVAEGGTLPPSAEPNEGLPDWVDHTLMAEQPRHMFLPVTVA